MRQRWKQTPRPDGGRGVMAARRTFNSHGGGSTPFGPIDIDHCDWDRGVSGSTADS